jgi:hypothetical protein
MAFGAVLLAVLLVIPDGLVSLPRMVAEKRLKRRETGGTSVER